jgi:uncharacterized protein
LKRKVLIITFILILFVQLISYGDIVIPKPTDIFYVNDFANVIDAGVEESIRQVNLKYENTEEKPQIVVATVENMQGLDENSYAIELFEKWKIGNLKYDNGILILLAIEERRIKIETGYGIEGAIPDSVAGRILDSSTDYLSSSDYSKGIENIFFQLAIKVNEEYNYDENVIFGNVDVNYEENQNNNASSTVYSIVRVIVIILLVIFFGGFGGGPGKKRRRGGFYIPPSVFRGISGGGFGGGGSFGGGGRSGGGGAGRGF